ncbi:DUF2147 domain-containing protein [Stakelama pacifica]|uniref:Uncharacterized protein (DUF2147 family) n=1 Tax=Stakelama pacifica TaxID=517720 RepID=A0A4R6FPR5_9SPHN|nr:DUF2147 domain-containing protein [Stakelama pacifica]TDN83676.1 uncharacterized protein (DUF2147 family) [Stakelama pacifica]GGO94491.1 hypothetical protein GCM10011329_16500 [Stakelama pacifica]
MHISKIFAAGAALALASPALAAPQPIAGKWISEGGKALVQIGQCGNTVCGKIIKVLKHDPKRPTTDVENPDPKLRDRPIEGLTILTGFTPDGDVWRGEIYDPQSGKTYRSVLQRENGKLTVKGCVAIFCKTQHWKAAN